MNLEKLSFIKKLLSFKKLLFALLIIIILLSLALKLAKKPEEPTPITSKLTSKLDPSFGKLPDPIPTTPLNLSTPKQFSTNLPENLQIPETITIYQQTSSLSTQQQALKLAKTLAFSTNPKIIGSTITFQQQEKYLIFNLDSSNLSYSQALPAYLNNLNQPALEDYALILIKQIYPDNQLWQNPIIHTDYYSSAKSHGVTISTHEKADIAELQIFPTIEGIRIIGPKDVFGKIGMITIKFFKKDALLSLAATSPAISTTETGVYPLKNISQATQEIATGRAELNSLSFENPDQEIGHWGQRFTPVEAAYTNVELVYYYNSSPSGFLHPMYLFKGTTTTQQEKDAIITTTVSAIEPGYTGF